ncbi:hypothetical protein PPERSA_04700 [Pseudocohnilembus persalinus]|uniref:EF-hand domain-containing protein n=1 Tax=Pseudocohnilembus persalinus TaxID=266149 RepID=A0A0V0R4I9_PSEPJ|nr:hypothetical protein PPERSA_04700 [Pseudocohnilembus persalinus]|eukprot:KRX09394.1 hypothetical protein PPERSA_04700 [Pseudocohnilembus persalinus]
MEINQQNSQKIQKNQTNTFDFKTYAEQYFISEQEVKEIKEAFDLFDSDKSGSIQATELKNAMQQLGFEAKDQTIYQMMSQLDTDGSGSIEFNEFLSKMIENIGKRNTKEDLKKVFRLFADESSNFEYITLENLQQIASELGENLSSSDLIDMINKADSTKSGKVDFENFYNLMRDNTY